MDDQIKQCLQKQIDELDMLESIFCNPGELRIPDVTILADIKQILCGNAIIQQLTGQLEYTIKLDIRQSVTCEISFELPHLYPIEKQPQILIRSSLLTKPFESKLKTELQIFLETIDTAEVYIYEIIQWIKDNFERILKTTITTTTPALNDAESINPQERIVQMERLWIYSHHIKSKTKRQNILKYARDLDLTGFLRSGKPGIICVEGLQSNTQQFWRIIRTWNWHKIQLRSNETKSKCLNKLQSFRRFAEFREELFTEINTSEAGTGAGEDDTNEVIMDMGLFMKFLDQHKCAYIKKDIFGFD